MQQQDYESVRQNKAGKISRLISQNENMPLANEEECVVC